MSDMGLLIGQDYFEEELEIEENEKGSEKKYRLIIISFIACCFILLGEFLIFRYIKPSMANPKITVSGYKNILPEEVAMKLLPMSNASWFKFDVEQAVSLLSSDAAIENVVVEKHFPDKINVTIRERIPVAVTFIETEGHSNTYQIDKNGILFETKSVSLNSDIPIVSGIPVEFITGGMRLPLKYRSLIEQISKIQELPQRYFEAISEICVVPKDTGNYELVLIPSSGHIKVLTDRSLNEDALKYMMVALDVVKQLETDVSVVDLRYGSVSYKS